MRRKAGTAGGLGDGRKIVLFFKQRRRQDLSPFPRTSIPFLLRLSAFVCRVDFIKSRLIFVCLFFVVLVVRRNPPLDTVTPTLEQYAQTPVVQVRRR